MPTVHQPADTSYTYNGTTISFSATDQAMLDGDIKKINDEVTVLGNLLSLKSAFDSDEVYWDNQPPSYEKDNALHQLIQERTKVNSDIATSKQLLNIDPSTDLNKVYTYSYVTAYNNDLIQVQNNIKFQIQTQQSNQNAANQNTVNANSLNNNTPAAIAQQNALNASLQAQQIAAASAKSAQTQKYLLFGFVVVVIAGLAYIILKKS